MQNPQLNPTTDQSFELHGRGLYDFVRILREATEQQQAGAIEKACNIRFQAFQRLMEFLPEDEEVILSWEHANSRAAIELLYASAIDHLLIGDYELSAAMLEQALELDPEDHLEATTILAFNYQAMDEQEFFDEVINDISDKSPERLLLELWAGFRRSGVLPEGELRRLKERHSSLYREFVADEHPVDEAYLQSIESARPTPEAEARELWLRTECLWSSFPAFIEALRQTAR